MPEDKRIVKTRAILRFALQSLLASEPFDTVTVKQICEAADVSRVTFYSHFPDKYALLNNLHADFFNKSLQRCIEKTRQSGAKDDTKAFFINLYAAFAEECFAPGRREFFYAIFKENGYALHAFKEYISKGTEDLIQKLRGLYDIDLDYGQLATLLMQSPVDFLYATAFSEGITCEKAVALCRDYYSTVMDFVLKSHDAK